MSIVGRDFLLRIQRALDSHQSSFNKLKSNLHCFTELFSTKKCLQRRYQLTQVLGVALVLHVVKPVPAQSSSWVHSTQEPLLHRAAVGSVHWLSFTHGTQVALLAQ